MAKDLLMSYDKKTSKNVCILWNRVVTIDSY